MTVRRAVTIFLAALCFALAGLIALFGWSLPPLPQVAACLGLGVWVLKESR